MDAEWSYRVWVRSRARAMLSRHIFLDTAQLAGIVMDMDHVPP